MTVTKLVKLTKLAKLSEMRREVYVSHIDKLNKNGLRVYGIIYPQEILRRIVSCTNELQRVTLYYQTDDSN